MKNKFAISLVILLSISSLVGITYSAWRFVEQVAVVNPITVEVSDWNFILPVLTPGDIVIANNDGTITLNGEVIESDLDFGQGDGAYSGDSGANVKLQIIVNENGTLSITSYDLKPNAALFGTNDGTVYFPQYLNVNGKSVLITSISEPVNFEATRILFLDSQVNGVVIPEGYQTICDKAFYDCSLAWIASFEFPFTLTQIGSQIINIPTNNTWTIYYNGTIAQWNTINKPHDWKTGSGIVRVICSNGDLTF